MERQDMAVETRDVPRIDVKEARARVTRGQALLVCAYADEAKCSYPMAAVPSSTR
jgi:hypothetical protein